MTAIPINANGTHNVPTWGESGTFSDSAYLAAGAPDGTLIGENDFNTFKRHVARWVRALRERMVWSDAGLYASFIFPNSGEWSTGGATLDGTLDPAWVMIDADDDGGVVTSVNVPLASPHTFTASRDTYVNIDEDGAIEYQEVANGAGAPSPSAGYVAVWKIVTDGTEITAVTNILPVIPVFKDVAANSVVTGDYAIIGGNLDVTGAVSCNSTLDVTGLANFAGSGLVGDSGADSWSFSAATTFNATASFNADVNLGNASGDTITCTGTLAINNNCTIGSNGSDSCTINSVIIAPVVITCASGTTPGIAVTGATGSATSHGGAFLAGNDAADALRATTTATASSGAAALRATAAAAGDAVVAVAANGFAGSFANDTSSPTKATLNLAPQDADPSSPSVNIGDLYINSARNKLRHGGDVLGYQSVHSSPKGWVHAFSAAASGTEPTAGGNEIAPVTITPEEVGDVLVEVTGSITFDSDTQVVLVTIYDTTSNSDVCSQNERAPDVDAGANQTQSFVIRGVRTLPSTAARTFVVKFGAGADVIYANVITSVTGVQ